MAHRKRRILSVIWDIEKQMLFIVVPPYENHTTELWHPNLYAEIETLVSQFSQFVIYTHPLSIIIWWYISCYHLYKLKYN